MNIIIQQICGSHLFRGVVVLEEMVAHVQEAEVLVPATLDKNVVLVYTNVDLTKLGLGKASV